MAALFSRTIQLILRLKTTRSGASIMSCYEDNNLGLTDCFTGKVDRHNGIIVNSAREPCRADIFAHRLRASLNEWSKKNMKTVWFHVERSDVGWIPHLVNEGFFFHHAKQNHVTLYRCLTQDCSIPPYAHTNLGVGAFVINDETNEVLVIKEKHSDTVSRWKLPGGYVEPGENIADAAERELFEETGVRAKFKSLIGFRHAHDYAFGCSDIYMVAKLVPETFEINKCGREISECIWMKIEDYANHPDVYELNRMIANKMMECLKNHMEIEMIEGQRPNSTDTVWIYIITNDDKGLNKPLHQ